MEDLTPLYNKEFYLAYLCGENVVLPIPDGNAERYLAYLCGMDVTIPDVPDGRTETYLAYKCGDDVVLPDPMYRIEYYLAKWCGIDCEVPEPLYRIEYWLAQLANSGELKTVTGNPISVSDALAKPAESLTIEILPQQDLHGYANPWPAGGGVNILPYPFVETTKTINGITFTDNGDGSITINGTATSTAAFILWRYANFQAGQTIAAASFRTGNMTGGYVGIYDRVSKLADNGNGSTATYPDGYTQDIRIDVGTGAVCTNYTLWPMLAIASTIPTAYSPYSNICPITGFTGVNIPRTGKNLLDKANGSVSDSNWWIGASGKATGADGSFVLPSGTYTFSASVTVNGLYAIDENNTNISVAYNNTKVSITLSETKAIKLMLYKSAFGSSDWTDVNIQLELGSTATAYEPYTGTTYSIDWTDEAGTVYGGELDVTTGVLTVTKAMVDLGTLNYSQGFSGFYTTGLKTDVKIPSSVANSGLLSDIYVVGNTASSDQMYIQITGSYVGWIVILPSTSYASASDFKTAMSGHQLCYELATPLVIQLTPTEIEMLEGNNTLWADTGDITVTYMADGPADDVEALNILLGNRYVNLGEPDEATDREALDILLGGR